MGKIVLKVDDLKRFLYGLDGLYEAQGNVKSLKWH